MTINLCIPSRGHPESLPQTVMTADRMAGDPSRVTITVALDEDDVTIPAKPETKCRLIWNIAPREDTLGGKCNRCAALAPADLYVLWADDMLFKTPQWDRLIETAYTLFDDGVGMLPFGESMAGSLPAGLALSHKFMEHIGFFCPPYFPFWWHETWLDEVGYLSGRTVWIPVVCEMIGGRGKTRGMRETTFWAEFFDRTRPIRVRQAEAIINAVAPAWHAAQLRAARRFMLEGFEGRNSRLRDAATAARYESNMAEDAPNDARYARIKQAAVDFLARHGL